MARWSLRLTPEPNPELDKELKIARIAVIAGRFREGGWSESVSYVKQAREFVRQHPHLEAEVARFAGGNWYPKGDQRG
jgi:hypothetical protein